jgi:hypothetical protein
MIRTLRRETVISIRKAARNIKNLLWVIALIVVLADIALIFAK